MTLVNIVVQKNLGPGIQLSVGHLGAGAPIDVTFERVVVQGVALDGVNGSPSPPYTYIPYTQPQPKPQTRTQTQTRARSQSLSLLR